MGSKKKKVMTTAVAAALVLALGLAGTFAWSSEDSSDGEISGKVEPGVKLHDDFNKTLSGKLPERNRTIYAENTGESSLYIRIKLSEYMTYGGKLLTPGAEPEEKKADTWPTHVGIAGDFTDCGNELHDYFELVMEGGKAEYNTGVANRYNSETGEDNFEEATKKETLEGSVLSMQEYKALAEAQKENGYYWVVDTDGYAYWSEKLEPDTATAPLLNRIINTGIMDDTFLYKLHAKLEAVTERDLLSWTEGAETVDGTGKGIRATEDGARLLKQISDNYYEIQEEEKAKAFAFDGDRDGFLTKSEYAAYLEKYPLSPTP